MSNCNQCGEEKQPVDLCQGCLEYLLKRERIKREVLLEKVNIILKKHDLGDCKPYGLVIRGLAIEEIKELGGG